MPLEIHQYNTFDAFSLHYRKDRVYHAGREFPAGFFATEILNFAGECSATRFLRNSDRIIEKK